MLLRNKFWLLSSVCLLLAACGGSGSSTGQLKVGITDAPIDSAEAVVVHVTSATLHGPGGDTNVDVLNPVDGTVGRDIDLLKFQGGQWAGLFDETVTAGHYSWIRLGLDLSQSYIQINGAQYGLRCNSCDKAGFRINSSFDVASDSTLTVMLDFDVRKSITDPGNSSTDYLLRPTVRLVKVSDSGSISGTVDSTLMTSLGGSDCSVYVFEGSDVTPDDVYIPVSGTMSGTHNNPVTTAKVMMDNNIYSYTASFLPEGDYTIALTCDAANDSAASNDTLTFSDTQNATVTAGATEEKNFLPAP